MHAHCFCPGKFLNVSCISNHGFCWHEAAISLGTVAWKKPEALAPGNIAAVVTAPARAAVGWVQENIIPPGEPLAATDAHDIVLAWQQVKAAATGTQLSALPHY